MLSKSYSHNGVPKSNKADLYTSQKINDKCSQTEFTPFLEQELVLGQYLEHKLGSDLSEIKVNRPQLSKSELDLNNIENDLYTAGILNSKNLVSSDRNLNISKWDGEIHHCQSINESSVPFLTELKVARQNPGTFMVNNDQEEII